MRHVTDPCPDERAFHFADGQRARSLAELRGALERLDPGVVWHHREHFQHWLRDVADAPRLGERSRELATMAGDGATYAQGLAGALDDVLARAEEAEPSEVGLQGARHQAASPAEAGEEARAATATGVAEQGEGLRRAGGTAAGVVEQPGGAPTGLAELEPGTPAARRKEAGRVRTQPSAGQRPAPSSKAAGARSAAAKGKAGSAARGGGAKGGAKGGGAKGGAKGGGKGGRGKGR